MQQLPGREWEHIVVDERTLWRQRRRGISAISSVCAVVIALVLMSFADGDVGVFRRPSYVRELAAGPVANHQGAGNALLPEPPSDQTPATTAPPPAAVVPIAPAPREIAVGAVQAGTHDTPPTTVATPVTEPPAAKPPLTGKGVASIGDKLRFRVAHVPHVAQTPHVAHEPSVAHVTATKHLARIAKHKKHPPHRPHPRRDREEQIDKIHERLAVIDEEPWFIRGPC